MLLPFCRSGKAAQPRWIFLADLAGISMLLAMRIAVAFGIWMGIHGGGLLSGHSQESEDVVAYPEVVEFAETLKDVRWTLRGTSSLKGLQFDGESMLPILRDGSTGSGDVPEIVKT